MDGYDIAAFDAVIGVFVLLILLAALIAIFTWSNGGKKACGKTNRKTGCDCDPKLRRTDRALASNVPGQAAALDTGAVNSIGIAQDRDRPSDRPANRFWIAQNVVGSLSLYETNGGTVETVIVPPAAGFDVGSPNGVAVAGSAQQAGFYFTDGVSTGPAQVVTVTQDGTIAAYNPAVDPINAVTVLDASTLSKTFKGCCFAGSELVVAEFQAGNVEVYGTDFALVRSFTDDGLVAAGYAPHNVALLHDGLLAVAFAAQDTAKTDAVPGVGAGYVDIFRLSDGGLLQRLVNQGPLNAPYGLATDGCSLLVGNHGDGRINAFDRRTGSFIGPVVDPRRNPVSVDGLYGIANQLPRKRSSVCCPVDLMYAAGPNGGANGLFGRLRPR